MLNMTALPGCACLVLGGELTAKTCAVWKSCLGRDLSTEDVRQIEENVVGFFAILADGKFIC